VICFAVDNLAFIALFVILTYNVHC